MIMKAIRLFSLAALSLAVSMTSCSSTDGDFSGDTPWDQLSPEEQTSAIMQMDTVAKYYVDYTVVPTYAIMLEKINALNDAVQAFVAGGTQTQLNTACDAWRQARIPWEESEAFLFGPADYEGLDPNLDSWPLDKDGIDQLLISQDFGQIETGGKDDAGVEAAQGLRGYHTLEYLLFLDGNYRDASTLDKSWKNYMQRVSILLAADTKSLYEAWTKDGHSELVPIAFGREFKQHNTQRFPTAQSVIAQIVDGCMDIASEVGGTKIGDPYYKYNSGDREGGLYAVESWYSWNSIDDYENNMISIENTYLGGRSELRDESKSLSALVRQIDADTDAEIRTRIQEARSKIRAIPYPFRNSLGRHTEVQAAMEACSDLEASLLKIKRVLGLN